MRKKNAREKDDKRDLQDVLLTIGKRVKKEREAKKWTPEKLAEKARTEASFVRDADWIVQFEDGKILNVWMSDVVALATVLGLTATAYFLASKDEKNARRRK